MALDPAFHLGKDNQLEWTYHEHNNVFTPEQAQVVAIGNGMAEIARAIERLADAVVQLATKDETD